MSINTTRLWLGIKGRWQKRIIGRFLRFIKNLLGAGDEKRAKLNMEKAFLALSRDDSERHRYQNKLQVMLHPLALACSSIQFSCARAGINCTHSSV